MTWCPRRKADELLKHPEWALWEDLAQDEDLLVLDISCTEKNLTNVVSAPDRVWAVHECSAQKIVSRDE